MKTLLLILVSFSLSAQCNTDRTLNSYLAIPTFLNLYFTGQCVSQPISDTTICVKVVQREVGQVAAFSYSSPNGQPAYVTSFRQFDKYCNFMTDSPFIEVGTDSIIVCYTIAASLIDNFCPYTILAGGLAVEWCGIYAYHDNGNINVRWVTCSNTGTKVFEVIHSVDAMNWRTIGNVKPYQSTTSTLSDYKLSLPFTGQGDNYFAVREIDLNGSVRISDVVYVNVPYSSSTGSSGYDLLGRRVQSNDYMYYIGK